MRVKVALLQAADTPCPGPRQVPCPRSLPPSSLPLKALTECACGGKHCGDVTRRRMDTQQDTGEGRRRAPAPEVGGAVVVTHVGPHPSWSLMNHGGLGTSLNLPGPSFHITCERRVIRMPPWAFMRRNQEGAGMCAAQCLLWQPGNPAVRV